MTRLTRKTAEEQRRAQTPADRNGFLENLLGAARDLAAIATDENLRISYVSPVAEQIFGSRAGELIGRAVQDLHRREGVDAEAFDRAIDAVRAGGEHHYTIERETPAGSTFLESRVVGIYSTDRRLTGYAHFSRDLTDRRRADRERMRLAKAVEHAAESILVSDASGIIQYVNPSFERVSGFDRRDWCGKTMENLFGAPHRQELGEIWSAVCRGESLCSGLVLAKKDGTPYQVEATFSPVRDETGAVTNVVSVQRDVTHEKELEQRLLHAQKMEAIGTLAGGIAHDFNNILSAIIGFAEMTLAELGERNRKELYNLHQIVTASNRARDLIQQILTFSRGRTHKKTPVDVSGLVKETCRFLQASLPKNIDVLYSVNTSATVVRADPTQMHQVLMNLCTNAAHAMRNGGGTLGLHLDGYEVCAGPLSTRLRLRPGTYLRLVVSDTGHGMEPALMDRIFDPYFSTKSAREGSGLGLSVSHGIIKKFGGIITVESVPGAGSSFHVLLPRPASTAGSAPVVSSGPEPGRGESILFVDDESVLADLGKELLERIGYRVTACTDSRKALNRFRANPREFDLVITDHRMPGMNGCTFARELAATRPDIPIFLCTGHRDELVDVDLRRVVRGIIRKPAHQSELARTIRRTLDFPPERQGQTDGTKVRGRPG